jgi:UDP-glucose 4-epimerase
VTRYLQEAGYCVEACDLRGASRALNVLDKSALVEVALEARPHVFVHAAALTSGEDLRVVEVNVQGTLNALEAARKAGARHFVFFSSCGVYAPSREPIREEGITTTASAYALSKLLGEQAVDLARGSMTAWLLRLDAVYGPGEQPSETRARTSVVHQIARAIYTGQKLTLQCAASDVFSWLHTRDLGRLLEAITRHHADGRTRLYNIAGPGISVRDLVASFQKIKPEIDFQGLIEFNQNPPPRHGAIDCSKVATELGFSPTVQLEEGLRDYLIPSPQAVKAVGEGWG